MSFIHLCKTLKNGVFKKKKNPSLIFYAPCTKENIAHLFQVPLMMANISPPSSIVKVGGASQPMLAHARASTAVDAHSKVSNGAGASGAATSCRPAGNQSDPEVGRPPEELFDSEDDDDDDDDDASSVATTTEAPSPEPESNGLNSSFRIYAATAETFSNGDAGGDLCKGAVVNVIVTTNQTLADGNDGDGEGDAMLNLPTNPQRGRLEEIPKGWLRKIIPSSKPSHPPKVVYYSSVGKRFSSQEEIDQYFSRLGQTVKPGLFNFEPPRLVDEDEDEDDEDQDMEDTQTFSGVRQKQPLLTLMS
jgi:hypothetical protein